MSARNEKTPDYNFSVAHNKTLAKKNTIVGSLDLSSGKVIFDEKDLMK
jgi:hypothetical protein